MPNQTADHPISPVSTSGASHDCPAPGACMDDLIEWQMSAVQVTAVTSAVMILCGLVSLFN